KSMLASRLPGILPEMSEDEALETAAILSVSNRGFDIDDWRKRPFRTPHHTASGVALVGGGSNPRPGEISLAHNGVMFLDELPEFDRKVLEVLREPLESGCITISRAARQEEFPAAFQLISAMNPCPCGYHGDSSGKRDCRCTADQVLRYRNRISGPLLDRIDMHVEVPMLSPEMLSSDSGENAEGSTIVRKRVAVARQRQLQRSDCANSQLQGKQLEQSCTLTNEGRTLAQRAMEQLGLSARAYHRILRLARTLADMAGHDAIQPNHISEAVGYRRLDRQN
ncbi:MAG: ATP-binding protein, partial [Candidatus Sedimenticola sp. (ex Thyasira tokunagai)]